MRRKIVNVLCALALVVSLGLVIAVQTATPAQAASNGPNSGSTAVDDSSIGQIAWSTPSGALTQNDSYATASLTRYNRISHYLKATDFGFSIPSDATIKGIVVEVDRYESGTTLRVTDNSIRLVKGGVIGGDNKSTGASWPSSDTDTYQSYGGSSDLWGLSWAPADINSPNFGVAISAIKDASNHDSTAYVDHIRITVYYNSAPTDIALSNSSVAENEPVNTIVGTLSTTDPDAGDTFTYTLVSGTGDTDNGSFNINGSSLRTSASFDYETKNSYSIRVRSIDQGSLWVEKQFTITVTDVNYDLTTSSTEGGSITEPGEDIFTYDEGTVVDLIAEAEEGYQFVEWTGNVSTIADVEAAATNITMNGDYSITANFEAGYPTVTTEAASNITANSSTLNMDHNVGEFSPVQVRFAYKKSEGLFWSYTDWIIKSGNSTYAESINGLSSNTGYDFKAQLKYNDTEIEVEGTLLQFTTDTPSPSGGCFIATAAYGTPTAEQIDVLREFRDVVLLESTAGSQFVSLYYQLSPPVADFISGSSFLRTLVRELLVDPIVWVVEATGDIWQN